MQTTHGGGTAKGRLFLRVARNRWVRAAGCLTMLLLCVALGGGVALYARFAPRWDEGWIDGERHALGPYAKPTFENTGRMLYEQAIAEMQKPEHAAASDLLTSGYDSGSSLPDLERALADFAPVYALLHEAADAPYFSLADPESIRAGLAVARENGRRNADFYSGGRALARAVATRVRTERRAGRPLDSLWAGADGLALGANVTQHGEMIDTLIGVAIAAIAQAAVDPTVLAGGLAEADYMAYADRVHELHGRLWTMEAILTFRAAEHRASMAEITPEAAAGFVHMREFTPEESRWYAEHGEPPPWKPSLDEKLREQVLRRTWDGDRSLEWTEDRFARLAEQCQVPIDAAAIIALVERTKLDLEVRRDPVAEMVTANLGGLVYQWIDCQARFTGHETMARLEAYRARYGEYPASLDDLVPDFATETPQDPWSGKPLVYRREGRPYRLYSVGRNQTDDGGRPDPNTLPGRQPDEVYVPLQWHTLTGGTS